MIQINDLSLQRGIKVLIDHASLDIFPGHKVAIIGSNGCGKSSLFALLQGQLVADTGDCLVPKQWRIVAVAQETPGSERAALEYVIDGDQQLRAWQQALQMAERQNDGDKMADLHDKLATHGAYDIEARAATILAGLGFSQDKLSAPVNDFSGGWRMRLNLARALLCPSDLLLLDEPTNHLDLDAVLWLEGWIQSYKGTMLLISHDKAFIDNCVQHIVSFEQQKLVSYTGNYESYERQRAERAKLQTSEFEKQERKKAHLHSFIARFKAKASKAKQAQSRIKQLEKMEDLIPAHQASAFKFSFKTPEKLPNPLVYMEDVALGYDQNIILDAVKLNLVPGSRIGLLGKNGAGKSTLIKLLSEQMSPQRGLYETSAGLKIGYFAQHQAELLDFNASAYEHLFRLDKSQTEQAIRDYLGGFGFHSDDALKAVAPMSGGEKARLVLALMVYQAPNLLLLDEPTNHLDIEMRQALNYALQSFEGAMVLVSHDRYLLQTVCDDFYLVDNGKVASFDGDLDDYKKWLLAANRNTDLSSEESKVQDQLSATVDRKLKKRQEAEFRQQIRPLRTTLEKQEQVIQYSQEALRAIETALADMTLYEPSGKAKLKQLLQEQSELKQSLETAELLWLDTEEQLEAAKKAFEQID